MKKSTECKLPTGKVASCLFEEITVNKFEWRWSLRTLWVVVRNRLSFLCKIGWPRRKAIFYYYIEKMKKNFFLIPRISSYFSLSVTLFRDYDNKQNFSICYLLKSEKELMSEYCKYSNTQIAKFLYNHRFYHNKHPSMIWVQNYICRKCEKVLNFYEYFNKNICKFHTFTNENDFLSVSEIESWGFWLPGGQIFIFCLL